jgi:hypothetical protein
MRLMRPDFPYFGEPHVTAAVRSCSCSPACLSSSAGRRRFACVRALAWAVMAKGERYKEPAALAA